MLGTHRMHIQLIPSYLRKPKTVPDRLFYMLENSKLLRAEIETRAEMMFAIVALSLSIATSWTKPNPYICPMHCAASNRM